MLYRFPKMKSMSRIATVFCKALALVVVFFLNTKSDLPTYVAGVDPKLTETR